MNLLLIFPELPACLAIMLACAVRGFLVPRDQWRTNWILLAAAVQVPLQILVVEVLRCISWLRPTRYDLYVYRIEAILFGQPSFYLGREAAWHLWFRLLMNFSYSQLVIAMIFAIAASPWLRPKREAIRTLIAFAVTFPIAVPIYLLIPVGGPAAAFPTFPMPPAPFTTHLISPPGPPNGFPSIHMATAILVFWYLRHWRWGQLSGGAFLILTALATMATGQHYFVDLVFAIPYAAGMVYLASIWTRQLPTQKTSDTPETCEVVGVSSVSAT